jgi:hypothetical protein
VLVVVKPRVTPETCRGIDSYKLGKVYQVGVDSLIALNDSTRLFRVTELLTEPYKAEILNFLTMFILHRKVSCTFNPIKLNLPVS